MGLRLLTPPAADPLTLAALKAHVRQDQSGDDSDLTQYLREATETIQAECGRQLVDAQWRLTRAKFPGPGKPLQLPHAPIASVASIRYRDGDGDWQTWATSGWSLDRDSEPGEIVPAYGSYWPAARGFQSDVELTYWAGVAAPVTALDADADTLTISGSPLDDDDEIVLWTPGTLPTGLSRGTRYFAVEVAADGASSTFGVATEAGGDPVGLSGTLTAGSLWLVRDVRVFEAARAAIKLLAAHRYEAREATTTDTLHEIPIGVQRLIDQLQWGAEFVRGD